MRKRTKALQISEAVRRTVWARDGGRCIICGSCYAAPCAHYISRAQGGLGVEENIVTLCQPCHRAYDQTDQRPRYRDMIRAYLAEKYPEWDEEKLRYRKWV